MKNKVIKTDKNKYFNWDNKEMLKTITTIPRMHQMWKMFSPNVLAVDNTVIVEAYLNDGTVIDLFTGKKPILDNTDLKILMKDKKAKIFLLKDPKNILSNSIFNRIKKK